MATPNGKKKISVDVISDTVCPWCYVGKRRLERAMARFADRADFTVRWLPFQLNPDAPKEGVVKLEFYNQKFGAAQVAQMMPRMARTFAEEGLQYSVGGLLGNTLSSHRLIAWSEQFGADKQNALVEELFQNYFCQEKHISDRGVLLAAAVQVGLPADGAAAVLDDPQAHLQEVQQQLARGRGVGGVPFFIINKSYKLSGAQPPEHFEEVFEEICSR
ncbi:hypothetical protein VOLCADRAFT_80613 [Volvox carteri f. nagariensis]|uniref:DSBA-like thioredoxin domain-containing protein n=1 Tax=Volvox carteri f. nagariensis TaxID=3068 RepID=D8TRT0_VOLCA|nr:uncharacterized protein VOLCADRAFT_80613 [Volvox carteri f. nagariensis]EFJ49696.1 hypothetical protein VOLCADRAFT_80613 [Volvox carteri f. nagariensis]|eukprot:XP_002949203.1 hypothetical protein VOLCADRAFT_80613 [Volvox carteri f. nagariensis]